MVSNHLSTSLEPACNRKDSNSICSFEIDCTKVQCGTMLDSICFSSRWETARILMKISARQQEISVGNWWSIGSFVTAEVQELVPILSIGLNEVVRQAGKNWSKMKDDGWKHEYVTVCTLVVLVLSLFSFYSICWQRKVSQHCLERGVVLEKIWRTYDLLACYCAVIFHEGWTG